VLSLRLTADTLTGATPNGATRWIGEQTFVTPAQAPGSTTTTVVTGASGGARLVTVPGPGAGTVARAYDTPAGELPLDPGFTDQRYAFDLGYSTPFGATRWSVGGGYSSERDYRSYSLNTGLARDFNQHNTTLSGAINFESDTSSPLFGTPTPFTPMSGAQKGGDESKTVTSLVFGVTQAMTRRWLAQLNYSVGVSDGYQTDPYRIISVVAPDTGAPVEYLYESRPDQRTRQSLYLGNKIALGPTFADVSARLYHDSWGINSYTIEAGDRIPITPHVYVEPSARFYHQSKADFFHDFLVDGAPLPDAASSDSRLGEFDAVTESLRLGYLFAGRKELYLQVEDYQQSGPAHSDPPVGALAGLDLFGGVSATSAIVGFSFAFR
jgi:hypothetical protein